MQTHVGRGEALRWDGVLMYVTCVSFIYADEHRKQTNIGSSDVLPQEGAITRVACFVYNSDKHSKGRGAAFGGRTHMCRINYLFVYLFIYVSYDSFIRDTRIIHTCRHTNTHAHTHTRTHAHIGSGEAEPSDGAMICVTWAHAHT